METIEKTQHDPRLETAPRTETDHELTINEGDSIQGYPTYAWGTPSEEELKVDPGAEVQFCEAAGLSFQFPSYQVVTNPNEGSLFDGGFVASDCAPNKTAPTHLGVYEYLVVLIPAITDPNFPSDWSGIKQLWDDQFGEDDGAPLPPRIRVRNPTWEERK